jgi:hypothetical protein
MIRMQISFQADVSRCSGAVTLLCLHHALLLLLLLLLLLCLSIVVQSIYAGGTLTKFSRKWKRTTHNHDQVCTCIDIYCTSIHQYITSSNSTCMHGDTVCAHTATCYLECVALTLNEETLGVMLDNAHTHIIHICAAGVAH